ncbi:hypothetical protein [Streptomyces rubrogriseus]|uniref:DUF3846 domain-containing protein n=1 Tax=Streptomyces rubrogriseus TaxID=194673 RepID=A0A6G3TFW1_9ACTN|nr:hypothetical protein [Streptomyces rubrogriseus]NEC35483.1 hypothetical protein [Streptomyces rubrogriseus]
MRAVKIAPDATVTELDLPEADTRAVIRELLGSPDSVDQGIYHRRAVLHVHGNGRQLGLPQNLAAWALASAWRGTALYLLAGPVAITGRTMAGELTGLDGDLVRHARVVAQTVRETLTEWRRRPPASDEAAISELLAYATRDISESR